MVKVAYTVGRFQPPTIGHKKLIEAVKTAAGPGGKAYVFVSSTQGTGKEKLKNPLTSAQKMPILKHMFPSGVEFVDTQVCKDAGKPCGGAIAAFYHLVDERQHAAQDITLVVGDDRRMEFGPTGGIWATKEGNRFGPGGENPTEANFVFLPSERRDPDVERKDADNMSGTKAREYVRRNRKEDFYTAIGYSSREEKSAADAVYATIQANFGSTTKRGGGGNDTETMTSADAEFEYPATGGRKTRRLKQSKASSKALYRRGLRLRNVSSKTSRS